MDSTRKRRIRYEKSKVILYDLTPLRREGGGEGGEMANLHHLKVYPIPQKRGKGGVERESADAK